MKLRPRRPRLPYLPAKCRSCGCHEPCCTGCLICIHCATRLVLENRHA